MSPIYEYRCSLCECVFERLELPMWEVPTPQCPHCMGIGAKVLSRPGIIYSLFNERDVSKLPDWNQKMAQAERHDAHVRRSLLSPLSSDRGQGIKEYNMEFGHQERQNLEIKAQLDNMG